MASCDKCGRLFTGEGLAIVDIFAPEGEDGAVFDAENSVLVCAKCADTMESLILGHAMQGQVGKRAH